MQCNVFINHSSIYIYIYCIHDINDSIFLFLEKKTDEKFRQDIDDLIEEHMKEMKKVIHNEILCQEILTESSSLEFQDLSLKDLMIETSQIQDNNCSSTSSISTIGYH